MRVVVFGSRDWNDYMAIGVLLKGFSAAYPTLDVIAGGAAGADDMALVFCKRNQREGLTFHHYPATWNVHDRDGLTPVPCSCPAEWRTCKLAGFRRNQQMVDEGQPEYAICAKDGFDLTLKKGGSEDMWKRLTKAGITPVLISHGPS